jgi:hypothetical protein
MMELFSLEGETIESSLSLSPFLSFSLARHLSISLSL